MRNFVARIRFRTVLPLLLLAVLITLPLAATRSKYVWKEEIAIQLKVGVGTSQTSITSQSSDDYSSGSWALELMNIQAVATAEGLCLTPAEGYVLPESITVDIGQMTYSVKTDGTDSPEGISFDPGSGLLSIGENLIQESTGGVTVRAAALEEVSQEPGLEENM